MTFNPHSEIMQLYDRLRRKRREGAYAELKEVTFVPGERCPVHSTFLLTRSGDFLVCAHPHHDVDNSHSRAFTCPVCRMTSYNPYDIAEGYCGNCARWTARPVV